MYIHKHRYIFIYMKTYNWTYNACIYISTDIYYIYMKTYNWTYNACIYISTDIYLYI